jgi:ferredoxin
MRKKIKVNQDLCTGCGTCVNLCPNIFKLREDGKAELISPAGRKEDSSKKAKSSENESDCNFEEIVEMCPARAITLEER